MRVRHRYSTTPYDQYSPGWPETPSNYPEYVVLGLLIAHGELFVTISPHFDDLIDDRISAFEIMDPTLPPGWEIFMEGDSRFRLTYRELGRPYFQDDLSEGVSSALRDLEAVLRRAGADVDDEESPDDSVD